MKVSGTDSVQTVTVVDSENTEKKKPSENTSENMEETQKVYRIGGDIVSKSVFDQYDTDKNGIISDAEKAAYQKASQKNNGGTLNLTA